MNDKNRLYARNYLYRNLNYYDKKAASNKKLYNLFIILEIVISAFIPFAALFNDVFFQTKYIVALMGSFITILSAFKTSFDLHKKWVEYRTMAEILEYHKRLYLIESAPYNKSNKHELLISNVNSIVEKENRTWRSVELSVKKSSRN